MSVDASDRVTDVEIVRQLVVDRTAAMRRGDAETIASHYLPDAVVFSMAPPLAQRTGEAADPAFLRAWMDEKGGRVWAELRQLQVTVDGDLALSTSLESLGAPPDASGQFTMWYRSTVVWRRIDDCWRIVHHHTSTPLHMDGSLRAATDLEP